MPFFSEGRGGTGGGRGNRRLPARSSPRAPRRLRSARGALGPHWPGAVRAAQWCVGGAASAASVAEATASGVSNRPPPHPAPSTPPDPRHARPPRPRCPRPQFQRLSVAGCGPRAERPAAPRARPESVRGRGVGGGERAGSLLCVPPPLPPRSERPLPGDGPPSGLLQVRGHGDVGAAPFGARPQRRPLRHRGAQLCPLPPAAGSGQRPRDTAKPQCCGRVQLGCGGEVGRHKPGWGPPAPVRGLSRGSALPLLPLCRPPGSIQLGVQDRGPSCTPVSSVRAPCAR